MAESNTKTPDTGQPMKDFQLTGNVSEKLKKEYGEKLAMYIQSSFAGTANYFYNRNARFRKNRQIANGRIDMRQFMDRLDMNGKTNYANINWIAIKAGNTVISRIIGRWMLRKEKIQVAAVDPASTKAKKEAQEEAEFVFENKAMLAELEGASGVPMIPQDQFVAEDKDELDQWVTEFNRLPEEIKYELGVNHVLSANGFFDVQKEKLLWDSTSVGLVGTLTEMNDEGEITIKWIRPENIIYSYTETEDFRDTSWRGHLSALKISELRQKYGKQYGGTLTEEEIFTIACTSKDWQILDKVRFLQEWNVSLMRPYDEWNVQIMTFEVRTLDTDNYTVTETKEKPNTIIEKGVKPKLKDNQRVIEDKRWNIYKGVYTTDARQILEWGLKKNMIRPQDPKEIGEAEFSYSFYMYQNYDMRNVAIPEKIEEPLEQMILARLKMQHLVAKMKPIGASINVDAMQELDLGLGNAVTPMENQRIYEQTGNLYYRGRDAENRPIPVPIQELRNAGFLEQMQGLIQIYQFHYQVLRDELGVDPNMPNQALQPRVAASNVQNSMLQSENATDYMYDAYLRVMEDTGKKVACLLNKSVTYDSKKYREMLQKDDVKGRIFSTKVEMLPTEEERARLQSMIDNAILSNPDFIMYIDPARVMRMAKEDVKLGELYFRRAMNRMIKSKQEQASRNAQENAEAQQASIAAKAQADTSLIKTEMVESQKNEFIKGYFATLGKGGVIPPELTQLVQGIMVNIGVPLQLENQQMQQEIMAAQEEEAMAQPQEEMVEEQEMMAA